MIKKLRAAAARLGGVVCAGVVVGLLPGSGRNLRADDSPPDGFRSLFDGQTLAGWTAMPRVQGSKPAVDGKTGKLASEPESFYERSLKSRGKMDRAG